MSTAERLTFVAAAAVGAAVASYALTWVGPWLIRQALHRRPERPLEVWETERHGAITTTHRRVA